MTYNLASQLILPTSPKRSRPQRLSLSLLFCGVMQSCPGQHIIFYRPKLFVWYKSLEKSHHNHFYMFKENDIFDFKKSPLISQITVQIIHIFKIFQNCAALSYVILLKETGIAPSKTVGHLLNKHSASINGRWRLVHQRKWEYSFLGRSLSTRFVKPWKFFTDQM